MKMNPCFIGLFIIFTAACAPARSPEIYLPYRGNQLETLDYQQRIAEQPVPANEALSVIELDRTPAASFHLVQIQTREPLHVHRRHDGTAILLEGEGTLILGKDHVKMKPGDVVTVPRNVLHAYINEGNAPSVVYVIFSPPFDGKDRVVVEPTGVLMK